MPSADHYRSKAKQFAEMAKSDRTQAPSLIFADVGDICRCRRHIYALADMADLEEQSGRKPS
jgi:hypothetical protein